MSRRKIKKGTSIWSYLDECGVLEKGSEEEIKAAKREYRKKYYLDYKRVIRKEKPEYTICLSKKNGELDRILLAAKKHRRTVTRFIKEAALAYIEQKFVVPNSIQIAELELLLANCLNEIKSLVGNKSRLQWQTENKIEAIEKRIIKLEEEVNDVFRNPKRMS